MKRQLTSVLLMAPLALGAGTGRAGFDRQVITLPVESPNWLWPYWADVDGDGRTDFLVVTRNDNRVYFYRQQPSGFSDRPSQIVALPRGAAWFALRDVDRRSGRELVVSAPGGLTFFAQAGRRFESDLQNLIEAEQVFEEHDTIVPRYYTASPERRTELPVIFRDTTTVYEINSGSGVTAGRRIDLKMTHSVDPLDRDRWSLGTRSARGLRIETTARDTSTAGGEAADDDVPKAWLERLDKESPWGDSVTERQDINADGRKDVVLWTVAGDMDLITKALVFLRTDRDTVPEKPTQILRLRGMPVPRDGGSRSLLHDVDGDGIWEVVIVLLKAKRVSLTTAIEAYVRRGLDVVMEIRRFEDGRAYARRPSASVEFTVMLPAFGMRGRAPLVSFDGDFNGDTCRDLIVRRSPTHIQIFLSLPAGGFFDRKPSLTVDIPFAGEMIMADLSGDTLSDITVVDQEKARIAFMKFQPALSTETRP